MAKIPRNSLPLCSRTPCNGMMPVTRGYLTLSSGRTRDTQMSWPTVVKDKGKQVLMGKTGSLTRNHNYRVIAHCTFPLPTLQGYLCTVARFSYKLTASQANTLGLTSAPSSSLLPHPRRSPDRYTTPSSLFLYPSTSDAACAS